jgi:hypothetical protein
VLLGGPSGGHRQLPWVELDAAVDVVVEVAAVLLVELVVAVVAVDPTAARSVDTMADDDCVAVVAAVELAAVVVAGAARARAAVPPTTPTMAADVATMRDPRVRLHRRRVAVLISWWLMSPPWRRRVGDGCGAR